MDDARSNVRARRRKRFQRAASGELYVWERVGIASRRLGGDRGDWARLGI